MVWAKAGPFASLGTADRRALALAHCDYYKSERLYCQYRRSLLVDISTFIRPNGTNEIAQTRLPAKHKPPLEQCPNQPDGARPSLQTIRAEARQCNRSCANPRLRRPATAIPETRAGPLFRLQAGHDQRLAEQLAAAVGHREPCALGVVHDRTR